MSDPYLPILASYRNALEYVSPYGYTPALAPGIAYIVCFAILTILIAGLGVRDKYWIVFVTLVPGGILEIVGWAGRLWSHYSELDSNPFIMQICCLILAPAFFSAWIYTILGYCIRRLGTQYSLLTPRMYLAVFVAADIVSLVLQAIGGGRAAVQAKLGLETKAATKIMLAGILFQLATMTIFVILATDFALRVTTNRPYSRKLSSSPPTNPSTPPSELSHTNSNYPTHEPKSQLRTSNATNMRNIKLLLLTVAFSSLMIFIRGIYRSVELAQGWRGYVIRHEVYFVWLDGFMMVLCLAGFGVGWVGWLLPRRRGWKNA